MSLRPAFLLPALLLLAACADVAPLQPDVSSPAPLQTLAALRCRVDARARTFECQDAASGQGSRSLLILGGQHRYVRLKNSGVFYDEGNDSLLTFVSVQNLVLVPLGTDDNTTPHAEGVRVFFETEPTNGVTVDNADGEATYLSSGKPYFQYSGEDLGTDSILRSDEESMEKSWVFGMHGATSFTFVVYVVAQVPTGGYNVHLTRIAAGTAHSCGLNASGAALCWGTDDEGELGNGVGPSGDRGVPYPLQFGGVLNSLSTGRYHSCGIASDDLTYCWGSDANGQLGNGGGITGTQPAPFPVTLPLGVTFAAVSAAELHTCALDTTGKAWCWGDDTNGRLGNGPGVTAQQDTPSAVIMPGGVTFTRIYTGYSHTCAIGSDGAGYCWGSDLHGALGNGPGGADQHVPSQVAMPPLITFSAMTTGHDHTCALSQNGTPYCWGSDASGQLGNGPGLTADQEAPSAAGVPGLVLYTEIAAGGNHTCALGSDQLTYCWGSDSDGQLGNGDALTGNQDSYTLVETLGVEYTHISAGNLHSCATSAGGAFCWGSNTNRRLGDGSFIPQSAPVYVASTN